MEIRGKTIIITGAASGIGRASALAFATAGCGQLHLVDVNRSGLEETARLCGGEGSEVATHVLDLSDIPATEAWFKQHGAVDILYNNAGIVSGEPQFPDVDAAAIQRIIDINFTSMVVATQEAAAHMRARGGGVIVNTISTVALGTGFYDPMYAASKAGAMMFTRCCASLSESHGVRVAGVLPGLVRTPIVDTTGANGKSQWMRDVLANNEACEPSEIADAVVMLVQDDALVGGDWVAVSRVDGAIALRWGHDELA